MRVKGTATLIELSGENEGLKHGRLTENIKGLLVWPVYHVISMLIFLGSKRIEIFGHIGC